MPLRVAAIALLAALILVAGSQSGVTASDAPTTPIVEEPCTREIDDAPYICVDGTDDFVLAIGASLGYIWEHPNYIYFAEWAERYELDIWQVQDYSPTWAALPHERAIYVGTSVSPDPLIRSVHLLQSIVYLWALDTYGYCPGTGYVAMSYAYLYGESIGVERRLLDFMWAGMESIKPSNAVLLPCE